MGKGLEAIGIMVFLLEGTELLAKSLDDYLDLEEAKQRAYRAIRDGMFLLLLGAACDMLSLSGVVLAVIVLVLSKLMLRART
ncbi:hypothetical protein [Pyrodictium abyssi]|uniref:Uncharacterized protein n=1 Tax=Pyrodictium abyssi TaxID=54256 RepID=A0ABN6ZQT4_9CREN|nr:hypothetical protein PABY_21210 [Pyrodictium abyssi]